MAVIQRQRKQTILKTAEQLLFFKKVKTGHRYKIYSFGQEKAVTTQLVLVILPRLTDNRERKRARERTRTRSRTCTP